METTVYWKKHEKEVQENKRRAEREAAERKKREEEVGCAITMLAVILSCSLQAREAERQSRKLNFLLTQTELFSHFIGSKMGNFAPCCKW